MIKFIHMFAAYKWPGPEPDAGSVYSNALNILFGSLGAVSLIVIIYASIRLVLSRGNPEAIGKLRGTLIYAALGLFVALTAGGIIRFALNQVG